MATNELRPGFCDNTLPGNHLASDLSETAESLINGEVGMALDIQVLTDKTVGYAGLQNDIPFVRGLIVSNAGRVAIFGVDVSITCSPAFAQNIKLRFEQLQVGENREISPIDFLPDHRYLRELDETEYAVITASASVDGNELVTVTHGIDVLAYDQWAGTHSLPELLAAFCMPNSRVVDHLLAKASILLRQGESEKALSGYQSKNREHVWKQVSAIYSVLLGEDIHYVNPPASFGNDGQKIRTPERIINSKVATCLDLAMLFASCLEQAGLHPVVLIKEGHAWIGVWLLETCFPVPFVDDAQTIRKRIQSGEFIAFEATGVSNSQKPSLRWACSVGEEHIESDQSFLYAIDIKRARELQIRPLPSRSVIADEALPEDRGDIPAIEPIPPLPPLDPEILPPVEISAETPEGRLNRWKSKLLDLTLRNRLLNFKPQRTTLKLVCPDPAVFEDSLSEGKEFRIRPLPALMIGSDMRDVNVYVARNGELPINGLARDALAKREIIVDASEEVMELRLTEIFRTAATGLEEGGANTLFLALGFLQWQEGNHAETSCLAPILLIPVMLTRQSVRGGFRLVRHDDEALVNPTLIQKLVQDFGIKLPSFDVLPTDEKGIDVPKIFQIFRRHIAEIKGWEVKEQVYLGIFSFTKYLMWMDLQVRQKQLQENAVVSHLINNPGKAFHDNAPLMLDTQALDTTYRPQDLFAPLLSDSSQLRAICVASEGKNLVIEGPPGTGKSQTITNLIAHLLATGKTVLFVSEKMAALEVVHRRLDSLGLAPFCLELHSSKAKKADVLMQLGRALDAASSKTVREWELEAERLASLRRDLNTLSNALHKVHPNDLTIYDAIGLCIKHSGKTPAPMNWQSMDQHSRKELEALREDSRRMATLAGQLDSIADHPLAGVGKKEWTHSWQQQFQDAIADLIKVTNATRDALQKSLQLLGMPDVGLIAADIADFDELADVLTHVPQVPTGLARAAHDESARERLALAREHGVIRNRTWRLLQDEYVEDVTTLDAASLELEWTAALLTWWPKKWFSKRSVINRIRLYRKDRARPDEDVVMSLLNTLRAINAQDKTLLSMANGITPLIHDEYVAHKTDWEHIEKVEQWIKRYSNAIYKVCGNNELAQDINEKLLPLVTTNRSLLGANGAIGIELLRYRDIFRAFKERLSRVRDLGECGEVLPQELTRPENIPGLLTMLQSWQKVAQQLRPWAFWQQARANAIHQGLLGLVRVLESGQVTLQDVPEFFEYSYQDWWVRKAIDNEPLLRTFSSADHERKINEFRLADDRFQRLTKQYVIARLSAQIPIGTTISPGTDSEMGKLRRELQKQRRHMPVRQLVQNLPTLMPRLKPCLLMSPLSVAQYLDAAHTPFDVVIFDEASQISVWDAVGAIARGRQLICVGDPKQLPPTNFFSRSDDEDSIGNDDVQDLESILDECMGIGMPKLSLDWHYRSRHESLITFSNVTYYDKRMITFPSATTRDNGVQFKHINGVYDRGGSRTNRAEADAIVSAIEKHYLSPVGKNMSLGVVTFNQAQQSLIENLLDKRRKESSQLDQAIAETKNEPLFIKNLENVQGDERDIIYFSITYGHDSAGKISMHFGPLNLEGGHRRLNVAVSRARYAVVVYSTLLPEYIDVSRVRASGVRDLKNYLEFAIKGNRALVEKSAPTGLEPESPFEQMVIARLRENGWTVHPQVGISGYRIDMAVVDPRASGKYLLGIECDGRTYHSGATARDRDRLRQHVLEGLGWKLFRIWSTDWWHDSGTVLRKLLDHLEILVAEAITDGAFQEPDNVPAIQDEEEQLPITEEFDREEKNFPPTEAAPMSKHALQEYQQARLDPKDSGLFYEPQAVSVLQSQLLSVINTEGPVEESVVFRRIARAWGFARTGNRIEERLRKLIPKHVIYTQDQDRRKRFYWPNDLTPDSWDSFRVAGRETDSKRQIDEICTEELGNIALYILSIHGNTTPEDLARSVCRLLGISRTSSETEKRVSQALERKRQ